ncbi:MAG: glutamate-5-semialdehyde dehydrogenase [Elusimicrobia bacterium]|nr:glutamate-5-semialdehyde dehydrogenase [Elusimicrobiota bacterium]
MANLQLEKLAQKSKEVSRGLAILTDAQKSQALKKVASRLLERETEILKANEKDLASAKKDHLSIALTDRLTLNSKRIADVAHGVREIAALPDPIGEMVEEWTNKEGLKIRKVRVPLGVVAMVYESRPNVTVESAALCLKSGNSVILRGGSEAIHSNLILCRIFSDAISEAGIPSHAVSIVEETDRKSIYDLARMDRWVDVLIARGSETMVREIKERSTVPVLGHGKGVCHVYVDSKANLKMAEEIAYNAKVQRPGVCNAMETLLVHKDVAKDFLPSVGRRYQEAGVLLRGDAETRKVLPKVQEASEEDWSLEYLDLILSIKVVDSLESAIAHINLYGSGHTDAIVTEEKSRAEKLFMGVDSAAVLQNASTRMHDGGVFGLGAEIGISTQKLHARGTMGIRDLTTTKYIVVGQGHIRK